MIHISQVLTLLENHLKSIEPKEVIHFKTYKKDRGFLIYCLGDGEFQLIEHGFKNSTFSGDASKMVKQAKRSLQREFPRSNTAWVEYYQDVDSPLAINHKHSRQNHLF